MAGKETLPSAQSVNWAFTNYYQPKTKLVSLVSITLAATFVLLSIFLSTFTGPIPAIHFQERYAPPSNFSKQTVLSRCAALRQIPESPPNFHSRDESDRFEPGTNATLIRNCVIFTGKDNGTEIVHGDILLDKGIVKSIGDLFDVATSGIRNLTIVDANGAWVTPGLVDLHTHLGVLSTPITAGAIDFDSAKGPILPWLRSIDGLNTHDESYDLAMAGGVTSAQVLPGSNNAIGGQAFFVKLRKPRDRSPSSMIIEPPSNLNIPPDPDNDSNSAFTPFRWRHMKQACGENLRGYGNRMDSIWALRTAYTEAMKIKLSQDEYCAKVEAGLWGSLGGPFPETLRWEMLVDVLRGRVKVSTHCYEAVDFDAMVRLTNEFKFSIASLHHAAEAYLVPNLLKRM